MIIIKNKGIATLPTVIVLGMMFLAIVVSLTSMTFSGLMISQSQSHSSNALFYAEAGARDALTKIARNNKYLTSTDVYAVSCNPSRADSNYCYLLDFTTNASGCSVSMDNCAEVSVFDVVGDPNNTKRIISKGKMKTSTRSMQVDVVMDSGAATDGEITGITWTELTN